MRIDRPYHSQTLRHPPQNFVWACVFILWLAAPRSRGEPIPVPNGSFESPSTLFVSPQMDAWSKTQKPVDYDETGGFFWEQLTGLFKNTPPGSSDRIDNCDGEQAVWLFAVPEVGLLQESRDRATGQEFHASFEPGKSYTLTVGVMGGGGNMPEGATLELSLYYRDDTSNQVIVASTQITNSHATFPNHTHLTDYSVLVPKVLPSDPHTGRPIGIQLLSTVGAELQGGYWDLDSVRLDVTVDSPLRVRVVAEGNDLVLTWISRPGYRYQLSVSSDFGTWSAVGSPILGNGLELSKPVLIDLSVRRFFRVVEELTP